MKRVVDTSAWIEWLLGSRTADALADDFPQTENCVVPTIVQYELAKWLNRERGESISDSLLAYTMTCIVAPLDSRIALLAAEVARDHKLAMADAIVYATAIAHDADLLTCDQHFEHLQNVRFHPKYP